MNNIYFFKERKTSHSSFKMTLIHSVSQKLLLISFLVLTIFSMKSQTAPNISYATPQNYLLNAPISTLTPTNVGGSVPALNYKQVSTIAGTTAGFLDGTGTAAKMDGPLGMTTDAIGNVYFVDSANFRIRKMTPAGVVTTIAGDGYSWVFAGRWKDNAVGTTASFNWPVGLVFDPTNNCLYVADKENDRIRKISLTGTYAVTTLAGSGASSTLDGTGTAATFNKPSGIGIDPSGTYLYVTDRTGNKIRRITISTAQVLTIAGSGTASTVDNVTGTLATFNDPTGIAVNANFIYVSDFGGNKIRKIALTTPYAVTTFAGSGVVSSVDGTGIVATFNTPFGIALDGTGNLYVTEWGNKIRKITPAGIVTTIAGSGAVSSVDGNGIAATFNDPANMIINPSTGVGYVSEWTGDRIRKIELGGYTLSPALPTGLNLDILTGSITGTPTGFNYGPLNYTITAYNYYGSSTTTVTLTTATLPVLTTTAASVITTTTATTGGDVTATGGSVLLEKGICWSTSANPTISNTKVVNGSTATEIYTSAITGLAPLTTYYVRAYATNVLGTAYGTQVSFTTLIAPPAISYTSPNQFTANTPITPLQVTNIGGAVFTTSFVSTFAGSGQGASEGTVTAAMFNYPAGLTMDATGNIYVTEYSGNKIRKITPTGVVSTFAGSGGIGSVDGTGTASSFNGPNAIAIDDASGNVYVADVFNYKIRKITPARAVSTFAGNGLSGSSDGGSETSAQFHTPSGVAVDASGNVYVADTENHKIRKITPTGVVSTFAGSGVIGAADGTGTASSFYAPMGVAVDASGNIYVADMKNRKIRKITPAGEVSTLAGNGNYGSIDGIGTNPSFKGPIGVAVDASGNVYVVDEYDHKIRKVTAAGVVSTLAGSGTYGSIDGTGTVASFKNPRGVLVDAAGNVYVADSGSHRIRKIVQNFYSIIPALPAGLVLNSDGSISGTPTVATTATNYTITATNSGGSSSYTINFAITAAIGIATWTGTQWINGPASTSAPAIIEGNYTPSSSFEVGELTIKNNAVVLFQSGHNLTINGKLTVETGSTLTLGSNANLLQTTDVANSGVISIKRSTAPLKFLDYVLWSSPVTGQQLQTYSPLTLSNRFYTYNSSANLYNAVVSPSADTFAAGTGYLIRMPNNHPTTPTIWTGTFTGIPTNGAVNLAVTSGTYNVIGNPYPSTIVADAFIDANGITEALYFWRKTNNSANPSYATYTKAGGVGTANSADPNGLIPNGVIQVGQGFITKATSAAISFTNAMRNATNGNLFLRTKNTEKSRIWLNLTNASGFFSQALVAYMDSATSGIDAAIDGRYFNDSKTALTSIINNEEFSIQGRSLPFDASDVVPIGFKTETAGEFTLAIDHTDGLFATGQKVFLKDNVTNTINDISTGSYVFASAADVFNSRFELVYQKTLGTTDSDLRANQVVVSSQNDKISIDAGSLTIAGVKVFDLNGRLLIERKNINAPTALITVNSATQMLFVHVITSEGSVIIKKILKH